MAADLFGPYGRGGHRSAGPQRSRRLAPGLMARGTSTLEATPRNAWNGMRCTRFICALFGGSAPLRTRAVASSRPFSAPGSGSRVGPNRSVPLCTAGPSASHDPLGLAVVTT